MGEDREGERQTEGGKGNGVRKIEIERYRINQVREGEGQKEEKNREVERFIERER